MPAHRFLPGLAAGVLLLSPAPLAAQRDLVTPRDRVLIGQMIENLQQALNTHDPEAWVAEFMPNARFINREGRVIEGRRAIRTSATDSFSGFLKGAQSVFRIDRIVPLGDDFALVDATHFVRNVRDIPTWAAPTGPGTYQTRARYVAQRASTTDWQVLAMQITPIRPVRQASR